MNRLGAALLVALPWLLPAQAEEGPRSMLYVAGERVSLEQAIADATLDALGPDESAAFQIVAVGPEMKKLTLKGTKPKVRDAIRELQRAGGIFYVCERDLKQAGVAKKDLLSGVRIEHAPTAKDRSAASLRRIRGFC